MENQRHQEPATPEEIWNILRRVSEKQEETDRQIQESRQLLEEQVKETNRRMKKLDEHFNSQWGKLMESLVEGDLVALLKGRGITVEQTSTHIKGGREGRHYSSRCYYQSQVFLLDVDLQTGYKTSQVKCAVR